MDDVKKWVEIPLGIFDLIFLLHDTILLVGCWEHGH